MQALSKPQSVGTGCRSARSARQGLIRRGGIEASSQEQRRHRQSGGGCQGLATSPLVANGHRPRAVCRRLSARGGCSGKPQARSHLAQSRWRSWGPLGSERSAVAQRGQASSRSPVSRTLPTGSAHCRGEPHRNRRQLEERRRSDSRPQASAVLCGGRSPAPPSRRRGQVGQVWQRADRSPTASSGCG